MKNLSDKIIKRQSVIVTEMLERLLPYVLDQQHPADRVLAQFFKNRRELGSRDRRFLTECFFSYFRWLGWTRPLGLNLLETASLSVHLDQTEIHPALIIAGRNWQPLGGKPLEEKLAAIRSWFPEFQTLEKSDLIFPELGKEKGAPTQSVPELGKEKDAPTQSVPDLGKEKDAPTQSVPELGKEKDAPTQSVPDLGKEKDAPTQSVPDLGTLMNLPEGKEDEFYEMLQQRPPTWIRLRNDTFKRMLMDAEIPYVSHPQLDGAVSIPAGRSLGTLGHGGQFEVQDIASQAVGAVAAPEKGSDWWDACAGAGGKALQLADLIGKEGKVFATDVRDEALRELKKRARTDGIPQIRMQPHDLAKETPFTKEWDGVLVDAPCSGWGTWSRNPDARWRTDPRDPAQKRNLQVRMLKNAAQCVKSGGVLIYAVCTFTTEETVETLERFLAEHPTFSPEPFANPLTGERTDGTLQIWPWDGPGDGMFIARLRRG